MPRPKRFMKYGSGVPFYRLEKLQEALDCPLPACDAVEKLADTIHPVYLELIRQAAQGQLFYNDDTVMRVLSLAKEVEDTERKGIFTTGVVSIVGEHKAALFFTGNRGENLEALLQQRAAGSKPPMQMCDALSRNVPVSLETILSNCLVHARFVDIHASFPEECDHLIEARSTIMIHSQKASPPGIASGFTRPIALR